MESSTSVCPDCLNPTNSVDFEDYYLSVSNNSYGDTDMYSQDVMLQVIGKILVKYVTPTDVFVGLLANIVSILVFSGKELRKSSSSVYVLSVLAADTGLLLTMLFVWLETLGITFNHRTGMCELFVYFQFVCSFLSVWYMVCITVENYITICHPLKIRNLCTLNRARTVVVSILVMALLLYMFSVFVHHVALNPYTRQSQCQPKQDWEKFISVVTYVDTILTLALPTVIILCLLFAIVVAIATSLRKKKQRTVRENQRNARSPQVRVAKMLFALSFTYLILNIPSHIIRIYLILLSSVGNARKITMTQGFTQLILQQISYINFYIKFFLFFAFSANFRKGVFGGCCRLFPRCQVYAPVAQVPSGTKV